MSLNNPRIFWFSSGLLAIVAMARSYRPLSDWMYTHWLFNYELEFVKRGLMGEVFRFLAVEPTYSLVYIVAYILLFSLVAVFSFMLIRLFKVEGDNSGLRWLILVLIFSSATFPHFHHDLGRFDTILLLGGLLLVLMSESYKGWGFWFLLTLALSLLILVHEGAFFIIVPFVLAFVLYIQRTKLAFVLTAVIFALMTLLTYQVSMHGKITQVEFSEHLEAMQNQYGDRVSGGSLIVLHKTSLDDQLSFVSTRVEWKLLEKHIVMLILLLPFFWLFLRVFKQYGLSKFDRYDLLILMSSLSPLLLSFLGIDFFRWWALSITLFVSFVVLKAYHCPFFRICLNDVFLKSRKLVYTTLLFGLMAGPLGITGPFPMSPF